MAKKLIPEELDALIQEYLTDGVLTEKERQVILKKAEGMGLDRDEIDLYLDAQVQKIDQATDAAVRRQKSKSCPYCGAPIPQLADKCPECGQFITPEVSDDLKKIIDKLEKALLDFKSHKDMDRSKATVEQYARKARLYYSNNPKIKLLLSEIETEMALAEKKVKTSSTFRLLIFVVLIIACIGLIYLSYGWLGLSSWMVIEAVIVIYILLKLWKWAKTGNYAKVTFEEEEAPFKSEIVELINEGNYSEASDMLRNHPANTGLLTQKIQYYKFYEDVYYKIITAFIKIKKYEEAEQLALDLRFKVDKVYILKQTIYNYMKDEFKKAGRDLPEALE